LAQAFHQGKYFADIAKKLKGSQWFLFSIHKECCVCESHSVSSSYIIQQNKKLIEKEREETLLSMFMFNIVVLFTCHSVSSNTMLLLITRIWYLLPFSLRSK
jgi:hypothetical protein